MQTEGGFFFSYLQDRPTPRWAGAWNIIRKYTLWLSNLEAPAWIKQCANSSMKGLYAVLLAQEFMQSLALSLYILQCPEVYKILH